jgi:ubiquinone/menaquinone biosynthesis C-methylase UbiE
MSNTDSFITVAPLYDELMTGVPYTEWVRYLHQLMKEWNVEAHRALDLACGTGNVSEILAAKGYDVTGVDIAPGMIAEARRKASEKHLPIRYYVQDAAELTLPQQDFDLCVSFFDSLNYILEPERLARAIQRVAMHLAPGGLFIFDLNSEFALANLYFDQDNLGTDERLRYDWDSEYFPDIRLCCVHMKFWYREENGLDRTFEENHWQYAYRAEEIQAMLSAAGFEKIRTYQAYTLRPPHRTSDRIFYVARR